VVGREVSVDYLSLHRALKVHRSHRMRNGPGKIPGPFA
jgi:hypothetical protein